jgi:ferric-dicitrate binding protein FerR (iron transport regulator)
MTDYKLEDFLADENFQQWALAESPLEGSPWQRVCETSPAAAALVQEARQILSDWKQESSGLTDEKKLHAIEKILDQARTPRRSRLVFWRRPVSWAAAVVLLGGVLTAWLVSEQRSERRYNYETLTSAVEKITEVRNGGQQVKNVILPDRSEVQLAPGARISYSAMDSSSRFRDVWLDGEAFFEVVRMPSKPFRVRVNKILTTVLGTSFRISNAGDQVSVTVTSGKVSVQEKLNDAHQETGEVILLPNEKAVYHVAEGKLTRSLADVPEALQEVPDLDFEETPLPEILDKLQRIYGIQFEYDREQFRNCLMTIPLNGLPFYAKLDLISTTTRISYKVEGSKILITGNGCGQ